VFLFININKKEKEDVAMSSFCVAVTASGPNSPPKRLD